MDVDGDLAMLDQSRKVDPWRKVAEFSLDMSELQSSSGLKTAWDELARACPPHLWSERLRVALQSTLADSFQRMGRELTFSVTFVISCLSPTIHYAPPVNPGLESLDLPTTWQTDLRTEVGGESWGFFVIDRPVTSLHSSSSSSLEHTIEICFYCE